MEHPAGPRGVGPFTACVVCGHGTWVRYGEVPLCLDHAR